MVDMEEDINHLVSLHSLFTRSPNCKFTIIHSPFPSYFYLCYFYIIFSFLFDFSRLLYFVSFCFSFLQLHFKPSILPSHIIFSLHLPSYTTCLESIIQCLLTFTIFSGSSHFQTRTAFVKLLLILLL